MVLYIIIYVSTFIFAFLYSNVNNRNLAFIFKTISFLILFIPIALRYNIGSDYPGYVDYITSGNFETKFEPGWLIFTKIILALNLDIQWFFVIPAFLSLLIIFNFDKKEHFFLILLAYMAALYPFSFSAVRQSFAIMIFLLATKAFLNKNMAKMLFWIVLSCMFHKSMILAGFMLLCCEINFKFLNPKINILILVCIFGLHYFGLGNFIMNNIVSHTPYASYEFGEYNRDGKQESIFGALFRFVIFAIFFVFSTNKTNNIFKQRLYNLTSVSIFALAFAQILYLEIHIFNRIMDIFRFAYFIGILNLYYNKGRNVKLGIYLMVFLFSLLYIVTIKNAVTTGFGGLSLIPYHSIFER